MLVDTVQVARQVPREPLESPEDDISPMAIVDKIPWAEPSAEAGFLREYSYTGSLYPAAKLMVRWVKDARLDKLQSLSGKAQADLRALAKTYLGDVQALDKSKALTKDGKLQKLRADVLPQTQERYLALRKVAVAGLETELASVRKVSGFPGDPTAEDDPPRGAEIRAFLAGRADKAFQLVNEAARQNDRETLFAALTAPAPMRVVSPEEREQVLTFWRDSLPAPPSGKPQSGPSSSSSMTSAAPARRWSRRAAVS